VWLAGDGEVFEYEAHQKFDRFTAQPGDERIDRQAVRADIQTLQQIGDVVQQYVNEVIAHAADETTHEVPTYADLNAAIDQIGELVRKYASLLKAEIL
jgi:hypothetical protein